MMESSLILYSLIGLGMTSYFALTQHELLCVVNKNLGTISHKHGGILGTSFGEHKTQHLTSEIEGLELIRYARRGRDTYQIRLALGPQGKGLSLSDSNLTLSECRAFAEQIRRELKIEAPLKAVN